MATKAAMPAGSRALGNTHASTIHTEKVPTAPKRPRTSQTKPEDEGLVASLCMLICNHQIGMSLSPSLPPKQTNQQEQGYTATLFNANANQAFLSTSSPSLP